MIKITIMESMAFGGENYGCGLKFRLGFFYTWVGGELGVGLGSEGDVLADMELG